MLEEGERHVVFEGLLAWPVVDRLVVFEVTEVGFRFRCGFRRRDRGD